MPDLPKGAGTNGCINEGRAVETERGVEVQDSRTIGLGASTGTDTLRSEAVDSAIKAAHDNSIDVGFFTGLRPPATMFAMTPSTQVMFNRVLKAQTRLHIKSVFRFQRVWSGKHGVKTSLKRTTVPVRGKQVKLDLDNPEIMDRQFVRGVSSMEVDVDPTTRMPKGLKILEDVATPDEVARNPDVLHSPLGDWTGKIHPAVAEQAMRYQTQVINPMYKQVRGTSWKVGSVIRALGQGVVNDDAAGLSAIRLVQLGREELLPVSFLEPRTLGVVRRLARELDGEMDFDIWRGLDGEGVKFPKPTAETPEPDPQVIWNRDISVSPYNGKTHFSHLLIPRFDEVLLKNEIQTLENMRPMYQAGQMSYKDWQKYEDIIKIKQRQSKALAENAQRRNRELYKDSKIAPDIPPYKLFYGPLSEATEPANARFGLPNTADKIHRSMVWGVMNKAYFDQMFIEWRGLGQDTGHLGLNNYIVKWINTQRGHVGFKNDEWIRTAARRFARRAKQLGETRAGKRVIPKARRERLAEIAINENQAEEVIREYASNVMKFNTLFKLFLPLSPRFPILNLFQTSLTTLPLVGPRIYARAVMNLVQKSKLTLGRARHGGVIEQELLSFFTESEALSRGSFARFLDRVLESKATKLSRWSEQINRAITFEAGRLQALQKGYKPNTKLLNTYHLDPSKVGNRVAEGIANGRALVDATQFILSKPGRSTLFTGSVAGGIMGQFRTFGIQYSSLFWRAWKHGQKGLRNEGLKMLGSLVMLGGPGAIPFYEAVQHQTLKQTGFLLPDSAGLVGGLDYAMSLGLDTDLPFGSARDLVSAVDITTSVEPFNLPRSIRSRDLLAQIGGPTLSPIFGMFEAAAESGMGSPQAIKSFARGLSPIVMAAAEGTTEYLTGRVVRPSGRPYSVNRSGGQVLARGLNLQPSVRSQYYQYRRLLEAALQGGNPRTVSKILGDMRDAGLFIDRRLLREIRAGIKAHRTKTRFRGISSITG